MLISPPSCSSHNLDIILSPSWSFTAHLHCVSLISNMFQPWATSCPPQPCLAYITMNPHPGCNHTHCLGSLLQSSPLQSNLHTAVNRKISQCKSNPSIPLLKTFQWPPVVLKIKSQLLTMAYKALHDFLHSMPISFHITLSFTPYTLVTVTFFHSPNFPNVFPLGHLQYVAPTPDLHIAHSFRTQITQTDKASPYVTLFISSYHPAFFLIDSAMDGILTAHQQLGFKGCKQFPWHQGCGCPDPTRWHRKVTR